LESLTRATLRKAEFGFFGVMVVTLVQTPRLNGEPPAIVFLLRFKTLKTVCMAGDFDFFFVNFLPFLTSWLTVGIMIAKRGYSKFNLQI